MRSLTGTASIYLGASALNGLIPFALLGYLAREFGPAEFGKVGAFLVAVNVASILVGLNTHGLVSVAYFRNGDSGRGVGPAVNACWVVMAGTLIVLLAAVAVFGRALSSLAQVPTVALVAAAFCAAAQFVTQVCLTYLQSAGQAVRYGMLSIAVSGGTALATLAWLAVDPSWQARAWGQLVAGSIVAAIAAGVVSGKLRTSMRDAFESVNRALRFGLPLVPHSIAAAIMAGYDRLYVARHISEQAAGQYFGAAQVASIITLGAIAFNQAWVPWLYARLSEGTPAADADIVRVTWRLIALALAVAGVMALGAHFLVLLVLGSGYAQAEAVLVLLAPAAAVGSIYFLVANHIFYAEKTLALPVVTCSAALCQVALIHLLGPLFGTVGVAGAVLATQGLFVAGVWYLAQRTRPLRWLGASR